jgi:hypothetical protein
LLDPEAKGFTFSLPYTAAPSLLAFPLYMQRNCSGSLTKAPTSLSPGLFFYTSQMPATVLTNSCTPLGLVNGARGIATGVVVDPTADFFEIDDLYLLCTKPPVSVLFQRQKVKHSKFDDLDAKSIPVFPLERSITVKKFSVRRKQVPMCPAFSLTDYKVQGSSFSSAVLDLHDDSSAKGRDGHHRFTSRYVQLSP